MVSGAAGSGKSIVAAHLANATCEQGQRCLLVAFEESPSQIVRNMRSVSLDLTRPLERGLLQLRATRPSLYGLEMHLVTIHKAVSEFQPKAVIIDPISSLISGGSPQQVKSMLMRLFDWLKTQQITTLVTCLTPENDEGTEIGISSLIDTWIEVRDLEVAGERNRALYLLKSRGMNHSNQVRELIISDSGVSLADVFFGADGVLVGSAKSTELLRRTREEQERAADALQSERLLELKRETLEAQIAALRAEYAAHAEDVQRRLRGSREAADAMRIDQDSLARLRTDSGSRANSNGGRA